MNVSLGSELDHFVGQLVKTGLYQSQSEVLREALRLLKREEQLRQIELEELRAKIAEGMRDIDEGRFREVDENTVARIRTAGLKKRAARLRKAG